MSEAEEEVEKMGGEVKQHKARNQQVEQPCLPGGRGGGGWRICSHPNICWCLQTECFQWPGLLAS